MVADVRRVLFICTGNYYRSRFAELLFTEIVRESALPWRADSRGTRVLTLGHYNTGPLSAHARRGLEERGIQVGATPRPPQQLLMADLTSADLIVAICEEEHRPQLEADFPSMAARICYWKIRDQAYTPPELALADLERQVRRLIDELRHQGTLPATMQSA